MTQRLYNFNPGVNQNGNDFELLTQYDDITNQTPSNTLLNTTSTISENTSNMEKILEKCLKEMKCLKEDNRYLRRKLIEYNDAHATTQTKLLTEIITIKRIITEKTMGAVERPSALPRAAFSQKEDFLLFEEEVKNNAEKFKIIENEVYLIGIPDPAKFVRNIWKRMVTDELACEISWINVEGKISLKNMAITGAFKEAFSRKFNNELEFKKISLKWFQTARDRVKYHKKKTQNPNI